MNAPIRLPTVQRLGPGRVRITGDITDSLRDWLSARREVVEVRVGGGQQRLERQALGEVAQALAVGRADQRGELLLGEVRGGERGQRGGGGGAAYANGDPMLREQQRQTRELTTQTGLLRDVKRALDRPPSKAPTLTPAFS